MATRGPDAVARPSSLVIEQNIHCLHLLKLSHLEQDPDAEGYDLGPLPAMNEEESYEGDIRRDAEGGVVGDPEDAEDDELDDTGESETRQPDTLPRPRTTDAEGNPFVTIVDVSGIHHLPVIKCLCHPPDEDDLRYIEMGLFPASYDIIKTVFTMNVLNDFRLANLECKTSAYQYYARLRRLTCPAFPKAVLDRYRELRRLSREYRNMKLWKMHGRAHDEPDLSDDEMEVDEDVQDAPTDPEIARGKLAIFCPTCPQPGVNIPDDWAQDPKWWLYIRKFCTDGNFKADHMNQKNEHDDVHLTNGEAFMTAQKPYQEHLEEAAKNAKKYVQVSKVPFWQTVPSRRRLRLRRGPVSAPIAIVERSRIGADDYDPYSVTQHPL